MTYDLVLGNLRRLRQLAVSEQVASDLGAIIAELEVYPVGMGVNSVRNNDRNMLDRLPDPATVSPC